MTSLLLCTDLDRTLLPNGAQPESPQARPYFARVVAQPGVVLAYVSGRDLGLVERAIAEYELPVPHYIVSDVGTNIYDRTADGWQLWPQWHVEIAPDWNGREREELAKRLGDFEVLTRQEPERQKRFKLSYYLPIEVDTQALEPQLHARLAAVGIAASLVWSIDEPAGTGLLDVLPARATKLHAVQFLQQFLQLDGSQTLFAGDSGNDLPALASAIPAVLVGNARSAIAQEAEALATVQGNRERLYLARGGFLGMNGNYSAGILEGLAHFQPNWLAPICTE